MMEPTDRIGRRDAVRVSKSIVNLSCRTNYYGFNLFTITKNTRKLWRKTDNF